MKPAFPDSLRRWSWAALFSVIVLVTASAEGQESSTNSADPGKIPDVYVEEGNSFVVSVPNLSRVAVGNPGAIAASVISPTEVLVQGAVLSAAQRTGVLGYMTSNLYVWSGPKRYLYRVVVLEVGDTDALPSGVQRMEVEPDRIILYGITEDQMQSAVELRVLRAAGLNFEARLEHMNLNEIARQTRPANISKAVRDAIARKEVIPGMTREEMLEARGAPLGEPTVRIEQNERGASVVAEEYRYGDQIVRVVDGFVVEASTRPANVARAIREAIARGEIIPGMTREEMLQARGEPLGPPTVRVVQDTGGIAMVVEDYRYPDLAVRVEDGYVQSVRSHVSPEGMEEIESATMDLGATSTRAYRLKYIEPQEAVHLIRPFLSGTGSFVSQEFLRLIVVEDDPLSLAAVDQVMRMIDVPNNDFGISIMRTRIIEGMNQPLAGAAAGEISVIRLGELLDEVTRASITSEIQAMANQIIRDFDQVTGAPPRFIVNEANNAIVVIGPSGLQDVLAAHISKNYMQVKNEDIKRAIEVGALIHGMTRDQVEIALKAKAVRPPRRMELASGAQMWEFEYPGVVLRFRNDRLYQILYSPTARDRAIARDNRLLFWGLTKVELDEILGAKGAHKATLRPTSASEMPTEIYAYDDGEAVFIAGRLEQFIPSPSSEFIVPGELLPAGTGQGNVFKRLTADERRRLMDNGIVVIGMSLQDVLVVYGSTPPTAVNMNVDADGRVTWLYTYPGQTVKVMNGVVVGVSNEGQNEYVTQIVKVVSRRAADIMPLIQSTFYAGDEAAAELERLQQQLTDLQTLVGVQGAEPAATVVATTNLTLDAASNSIIIRDQLSRINEIVKFVRRLDQETTKQVIIEAKFVEMTRDVVSQLGVQWGLSATSDRGNTPFAGFRDEDAATDAGAPDARVQGDFANSPYTLTANTGFLLGLFGANGFSLSGLRYTNVDVMISALEKTGDATTLSSPRILTLNNQEAQLQDIRRVYDVYLTQTVNEFGIPITTTTVDEKEVGITLTVTPTIGEDGIITMDLRAVVSAVEGDNPQQFGDAFINVIEEKNARSRVMVRSGMPLVIGGLNTKTSARRQQKVPILGSIPWLGRLFRTDVDRNQNRDLIVFLTASVVPADGSTSRVDKIVTAPRPSIPNPVPSYMPKEKVRK